MWNGNTTLEWSKHCLDLILNWDTFKTHSILNKNTVSKFDLLNLFKKVYGKNDIVIKEKELGKDKTLVADIKTKSI